MSTPFDRFMAREDRLSALIQQISPYEPPASMRTDFAERAKQAQGGFSASPIFDPPESLAKDFHKAAAQLDAAQQERQAAALREIAAGKPVDEVLGGSVSPASEHWLQQQAGEEAGKPRPVPRQPAPKRFWLGWRDVQLVSLAAILTAWATHHYLLQQPNQMAGAMLEVFRQVGAAHQLMMPEDSPPVAAAEAAPESASQADKALPVTPGETTPPSPQGVPANAATAPRPPAPIAHAAGKRAKNVAASSAPGLAEPLRPARVQAARGHAATPARQEAMEEPPPVPVATAPAPALRLQKIPAPTSTAPLQRQTMEPPGAVTPAPATVKPLPETTVTVTLADNPETIAGKLGESPLPGITVFSTTPSAPAVEAWVGSLRKALQGRHPEIVITIRPDDRLAPDVLRITTAPR